MKKIDIIITEKIKTKREANRSWRITMTNSQLAAPIALVLDVVSLPEKINVTSEYEMQS